MAHWIAFDEESTAVAAARTGMAVTFQRGDALDNALAGSKPAIVLLPGASSDDVLVIEVRRNTGTAAASPVIPGEHSAVTFPNEPIAYEPAGFLGLADRPIFDGEASAEKRKKWWKRLLD